MNWFQVISGISLVFGLLLLFYWISSRLTGHSLGRGRRQLIQILERQPLGERRALMVIRVGREAYLIGATGNSISLLSQLESSSVSELGEPEVETDEADPQTSFRRLLGTLR